VLSVQERFASWLDDLRRWWRAPLWVEPPRGLGTLLAIVTVSLVSLVIALLERVWIEQLSLSMLYLIAVLAVASLAGRGAAVLAAVLAFVEFDYLFVTPRYTFTISDPNEWLALLVFLATALVTGQLTAALRHQARAAEQRARETAMLYDLSRALMTESTLPGTLRAITDRIVAVFEVRSCAVLVPGEAARLTVAAATGPLALGDVSDRDVQAVVDEVWSSGEPRWIGPRGRVRVVGLAPAQSRRALYLPLRASGEPLGVLRVGARPNGTAFTPVEERTLVTFAAQAALAIARARLADEASQAEIARRSDELKSALLSSVSHDLRTPLASIKTAVTSLLQPGMAWTDDDRRDFLAAIDEETDRLTRLVANLLDLSRIEAGTLRPDTDTVDIADAVGAVVRRLRDRLADHVVTVSAESELPLACCDPVHLDQILTNLLENAAKYAPAGTPIDVTIRSEPGSVEVTVVDHGPGIPEAERAQVFDKFYRLGRDRRRASGTGLGLAIVRGLAEANGGRVWLAETPGGGTTAHVNVPAAADAPVAPEPLAGAGRRA
jgi:two-component system sensor histidine kinase KdpD